MSFHGAWLTFMLKKPISLLSQLVTFAPDDEANERPSDGNATSISSARMARASLVSVEKNLNETCWTGTFPPHQCGLAVRSMPVVGSKLVTCHGPVAITSVPGLPKVALCAS